MKGVRPNFCDSFLVVNRSDSASVFQCRPFRECCVHSESNCKRWFFFPGFVTACVGWRSIQLHAEIRSVSLRRRLCGCLFRFAGRVLVFVFFFFVKTM